jgi:hypothetical protein
MKMRDVLEPPVPHPFNFDFSARRPLVPLPFVRMILDKSTREVMELIEDGKLRWAFDLRSAAAERREVRVLNQSLFEYVGLLNRKPSSNGGEETEFTEIMDLILPKGIFLSPATFHSSLAGPGKPAAHNSPLPLSPLAKSASKMLFPREAILRGTEIARCFSCLSQHVLNLIKDNSFRTVNLRRGPKASPLVTRASVVEFLKKRRLP